MPTGATRLYEPLQRFLAAVPGDEATLTFTALEKLLGAPLPAAAWWQAWWANVRSSEQGRTWLKAGWSVRWLRRTVTDAAVTFVRSQP